MKTSVRRRTLLLAVAASSLLASLPAQADVGGSPTVVPVKDSRDTFLKIGTTIDILATGWAGYGLIAGERPLMGSGLTLVGTAPVIAYGATVIDSHPSDAASWAITLWAGALFTKACIDIVASNHITPRSNKPSEGGPHISFLPTIVQGIDKPTGAVAIAGNW